MAELVGAQHRRLQQPRPQRQEARRDALAHRADRLRRARARRIYENEDIELEPMPYIVDRRRRVRRSDDRRRQRDRGARCSGWRRWRARPASTSSWRRSGHRSTSSPAPSRPTSRPASASRWRPRSTAAPFSTSRAPSSCSARATCCSRPARARSCACMGRSSPTRRSRAIAELPARPGRAALHRRHHATRPAGTEAAQAEARRRQRRRSLRPGRRHRAARPQGLDELRAAPPVDRLQPCRRPHRAHGARGPDLAGQQCRTPRYSRWRCTRKRPGSLTKTRLVRSLCVDRPTCGEAGAAMRSCAVTGHRSIAHLWTQSFAMWRPRP